MKSILLVKKLLGLVEMMTGLVNASFSLPGRQAVKKIFFAPCILEYLGLSITKRKKPFSDFPAHGPGMYTLS